MIKALDGAAFETWISAIALAGIGMHFLLPAHYSNWPLYAVLAIGGPPLLWSILRRLFAGEFGADLLAGIAIVVSIVMAHYLVGAILVLMFSGGGALERFASGRASSVLDALAQRMPKTAHRKTDQGMTEIRVAEIEIGDILAVLPHELCPVDGIVVEGQGTMDESYLTGEPFDISKIPGSKVLSGAINGEQVLTIEAQKLAADSRYASIMRVMADAERDRPQLRRLGDQIAAWYTPLTLALAGLAWYATSDPNRFLAVLVVATPCPMLIAIPVAVMGSISLAASHGIVIKRPAILERLTQCRTVILDKTGTLTFGKPSLTETITAPGTTEEEALRLAASLEQYSRHPLAGAIVGAAEKKGLPLIAVHEAAEKPGVGLTGSVNGRKIVITGRKTVDAARFKLPPGVPGLECLVFVDDAFAAALRFHDAAQPDSKPFLAHLPETHDISKVMLVSGDRESEVRYLADRVGIQEIAAGKSPEEKVAIVTEETKKAQTLFVGDGINDAPALAAATVGVAIGTQSDITTEAAGAVIMTPAIGKLDDLIHIGLRMRRIALQSAVGGMALSLIGMIAAALGYLPPLQGAIAQELIDLLAILNALRAAFPRKDLRDF